MRSYAAPSWVAIALGIATKIIGFAIFFMVGATDKSFMLVGPALVSGALLLAAGLLGLQMAWNNCCDWDDGCGCCGDSCSCGDCGDCRSGGENCGCCGDDCDCGDCGDCGKGDGGHAGHSHD